MEKKCGVVGKERMQMHDGKRVQRDRKNEKNKESKRKNC